MSSAGAGARGARLASGGGGGGGGGGGARGGGGGAPSFPTVPLETLRAELMAPGRLEDYFVVSNGSLDDNNANGGFANVHLGTLKVPWGDKPAGHQVALKICKKDIFRKKPLEAILRRCEQSMKPWLGNDLMLKELCCNRPMMKTPALCDASRRRHWYSILRLGSEYSTFAHPSVLKVRFIVCRSPRWGSTGCKTLILCLPCIIIDPLRAAFTMCVEEAVRFYFAERTSHAASFQSARARPLAICLCIDRKGTCWCRFKCSQVHGRIHAHSFIPRPQP